MYLFHTFYDCQAIYFSTYKKNSDIVNSSSEHRVIIAVDRHASKNARVREKIGRIPQPTLCSVHIHSNEHCYYSITEHYSLKQK
jgi:hypothetical protein